VSGDRLDLDAVEECADMRAWTAPETVLALVAKVRRLRALESRLGELPGQWTASTADGLGYRREHWRGPDYAEGVDVGVEGCADVLRRTLAGE
jgi:hypothetical protein